MHGKTRAAQLTTVPFPQDDGHKLPDLLAPDLRVIFVGTAAGKRSAELGHYYAGRGNRFWRTLHEVGLTPRLFEPREFRDLLALGIGLTDMSKLGAGMDHQIAKHEFDPKQFVGECSPLSAARHRLHQQEGRQHLARQGRDARHPLRSPARSATDFPEVFVLPSPSGAARSYWSITPWQELADWVRELA